MKRIANNPSGKYVQMNDEQIAREQAALDRAVERQAAKDAEAAAEGRRIMDDIARQGWAYATINGKRMKVR